MKKHLLKLLLGLSLWSQSFVAAVCRLCVCEIQTFAETKVSIYLGASYHNFGGAYKKDISIQ